MQNKGFVELTYPIINGNQLYDYNQMRKDIELLEMIYPFIQKEIIGTSVCGRELFHLKIGEGKKKIHINASFHGNEWITSSILMLFMNEYCLSLFNEQLFGNMNAEQIFKEITFSFVPMVNPDGVQIVLYGPDKNLTEKIDKMNVENHDYSWWKANINGVDLNNQFPANWQIEKERKYATSPAPRDYPGDYPLSEPEAIAMARLTNREHFDMVIALHSQGKEIYWGYEGFELKESEEIVRKLEMVCGYKAIKNIDSHAGFRDWYIKEFRNPGFTIEVGKGVNPLPISTFYTNYQEVKKIILSICK